MSRYKKLLLGTTAAFLAFSGLTTAAVASDQVDPDKLTEQLAALTGFNAAQTRKIEDSELDGVIKSLRQSFEGNSIVFVKNGRGLKARHEERFRQFISSLELPADDNEYQNALKSLSSMQSFVSYFSDEQAKEEAQRLINRVLGGHLIDQLLEKFQKSLPFSPSVAKHGLIQLKGKDGDMGYQNYLNNLQLNKQILQLNKQLNYRFQKACFKFSKHHENDFINKFNLYLQSDNKDALVDDLDLRHQYRLSEHTRQVKRFVRGQKELTNISGDLLKRSKKFLKDDLVNGSNNIGGNAFDVKSLQYSQNARGFLKYLDFMSGMMDTFFGQDLTEQVLNSVNQIQLHALNNLDFNNEPECIKTIALTVANGSNDLFADIVANYYRAERGKKEQVAHRTMSDLQVKVGVLRQKKAKKRNKIKQYEAMLRQQSGTMQAQADQIDKSEQRIQALEKDVQEITEHTRKMKSYLQELCKRDQESKLKINGMTEIIKGICHTKDGTEESKNHVSQIFWQFASGVGNGQFTLNDQYKANLFFALTGQKTQSGRVASAKAVSSPVKNTQPAPATNAGVDKSVSGGNNPSAPATAANGANVQQNVPQPTPASQQQAVPSITPAPASTVLVIPSSTGQPTVLAASSDMGQVQSSSKQRFGTMPLGKNDTVLDSQTWVVDNTNNKKSGGASPLKSSSNVQPAPSAGGNSPAPKDKAAAPASPSPSPSPLSPSKNKGAKKFVGGNKDLLQITETQKLMGWLQIDPSQQSQQQGTTTTTTTATTTSSDASNPSGGVSGNGANNSSGISNLGFSDFSFASDNSKQQKPSSADRSGAGKSSPKQSGQQSAPKQLTNDAQFGQGNAPAPSTSPLSSQGFAPTNTGSRQITTLSDLERYKDQNGVVGMFDGQPVYLCDKAPGKGRLEVMQQGSSFAIGIVGFEQNLSATGKRYQAGLTRVGDIRSDNGKLIFIKQ
jgi:uncharacterized protein YoxC